MQGVEFLGGMIAAAGDRITDGRGFFVNTLWAGG
jgi:hypothetical protein